MCLGLGWGRCLEKESYQQYFFFKLFKKGVLFLLGVGEWDLRDSPRGRPGGEKYFYSKKKQKKRTKQKLQGGDPKICKRKLCFNLCAIFFMEIRDV